MRAELGLPSVRGDDEKGGGMMGGFGGRGATSTMKAKRPIQVKFEIPYFTTSGIQVRYLKIIEPKVSRKDSDSMILTITVTISESTMGQIHHTERRYRCQTTRCTVMIKAFM